MSDRMEEESHITSALRDNGYPLPLVQNFSKISDEQQQEKQQPDATVVIPYIRNLSESIRRILATVNVRTCFRPYVTLRKALVHPKTRIPDHQKTGVIYKIPCGSCDKVYIGQTGRTLEHRVKEHRRALTLADTFFNTSAVAEHAMNHSHEILWAQAKVVDHQPDQRQRCLLESWFIRKEGKHAMNRENGNLPEVYSSILS